MNELIFEEHHAVSASAPNRADVALFVGFVRRRPRAPLPGAVRRWLEEQGWTRGPYARSSTDVDDLLNLPVPIDAWDLFEALFAWDQRVADASEWRGATYLGAAVRSFFAQGGRRCYVVRVADPWIVSAPRAERLGRIAQLVPGYPSGFDCSPADRGSWRGIGHLFGLPDVSFVCMPDLPDAIASDAEPVETRMPLPQPGVEQWVECSAVEPSVSLAVDTLAAQARAPRCADADYADWSRAVSIVGTVLASKAREVQLVAAVPLPRVGTVAAGDLLGFLLDRGSGPLASAPGEQPNGLASRFIQLAYPWVRTGGSTDLPEALESPDGVLVGLLARNALVRGTYRSAARQHLADVYAVYPELRRDQMLIAHADTIDARAASHTLSERISLMGQLPDGLALLSDVTSSITETYRPASVSRLQDAIVRAARRFGEDSVFEASDQALWAGLAARLSGLLFALLQDGALRGDTTDDAFQVRCDRSTMTQNDLDNGRVVAEITYQPAMPVERIRVVLALNDGGLISLQPGSALVAA